MLRRASLPLLIGTAFIAATMPVVVALLSRSAGWTYLTAFAVISSGIVTASLGTPPMVRRAGLAAITGILTLVVGTAAALAFALRNVDF